MNLDKQKQKMIEPWDCRNERRDREKRREAMNTSTIKINYPFKKHYEMTSTFGWRDHPVDGLRKRHDGYDFKSPTLSSILAVADGSVFRAGWQADVHIDGFDSVGFGLRVWQQIKIGGVIYDVFYGHCSAISVMERQQIKAGDLIGHPGKTGHSKGVHLHIGFRNAFNGNWVKAIF